jgi:hypothetical protein
MPDLRKSLQDAAYVAVGLGVIGFQRAQVRRQELTKQLDAQRQQLESQMGEARTQVQKLMLDVEERLQPLRTELEQRVTTFEELLPEQARGLVEQVLTLARETEAQARKVFFNGNRAAA